MYNFNESHISFLVPKAVGLTDFILSVLDKRLRSTQNSFSPISAQTENQSDYIKYCIFSLYYLYGVKR